MSKPKGIRNSMVLSYYRRARKGDKAAKAQLERTATSGVTASGEAQVALQLLKNQGK